MLAMAAIQLVTAASGTLVALYFAETGASQASAAIASASYSLGFLLGCFFAAGPISKIGYIRSFSAGAAISAGSALVFSLTEFEPALFFVRLMTGVATAGLFAIGDSWINEAADKASRGRLLAIYAVVMGIMSVTSQIVIVLAPDDLDRAFVLVTLLYCFAIVVIAATRTTPPEIKSSANVRVLPLLKEAPTAMTGAFAVGFVQISVLSIVPYRLSVLGVSTIDVALLIGATYLGRILLQFPLGKRSDSTDRRRVIFAASLFATIILLGLSYFGTGDGVVFLQTSAQYSIVPFLVISILLGGSLLTIYSLLVAHALDRSAPVFVSSSAVTMLLSYTIGSVVGPLFVSFASEIAGDGALGWICFVVMACYTIYGAYRIKTVEPAPRAEKAERPIVNQNSLELAPAAKR